MSRISRILVVAILLYPTLLFGEEKLLTIIHTNDLHSHLLGFSPNIDYTPLKIGDDQTVGGWAKGSLFDALLSLRVDADKKSPEFRSSRSGLSSRIMQKTSRIRTVMDCPTFPRSIKGNLAELLRRQAGIPFRCYLEGPM
jgi:hypothetical protein